MKRNSLLFIAVAVLTLAACGNGSADKKAKANEPVATEKKAETQVAPKFERLGDITDENYAELIKALCGVDTNLGNGLTFSKTLQSPGNATIVYSGAKGIEERDLQKIVFERCQAVADGGTIYKLESNAEQGIHKGEPIASFDDFKGVNWVYEYKGVLVNCSPSKYGGSKSVDRFELRFGR